MKETPYEKHSKISRLRLERKYILHYYCLPTAILGWIEKPWKRITKRDVISVRRKETKRVLCLKFDG